VKCPHISLLPASGSALSSLPAGLVLTAALQPPASSLGQPQPAGCILVISPNSALFLLLNLSCKSLRRLLGLVQ